MPQDAKGRVRLGLFEQGAVCELISAVLSRADRLQAARRIFGNEPVDMTQLRTGRGLHVVFSERHQVVDCQRTCRRGQHSEHVSREILICPVQEVVDLLPGQVGQVSSVGERLEFHRGTRAQRMRSRNVGLQVAAARYQHVCVGSDRFREQPGNARHSRGTQVLIQAVDH